MNTARVQINFLHITKVSVMDLYQIKLFSSELCRSLHDKLGEELKNSKRQIQTDSIKHKQKKEKKERRKRNVKK